ncbi:hypothetical protein [Collimonas antrihumi]|uniref:hypothetical protein n=1 Tax=Collimonas antrihumi TaxID=1940615 RepID=UPI001B8BAA1F|nr:hypothetical protein [Collimonas antrihumi]
MDPTQNTPKPTLRNRWIEVFKAGTNTDAKGNVCTFTQADLDQIVVNHQLGAAPAVLGHPKHNDPAYAWTEDVKREGDLLFVKFKDIHPAFEAGVQTGAYRNRSVSLVKDKEHGFRLRHVGWLGAAAPAIDGLTPIQFSADGETMEFASSAVSSASWALENCARLFRGLREYLIAEKGQEEADRLIPNYQITSIEDAADDVGRDNSGAPTFSTGADAMQFTQEQMDAATAAARTEATQQASQQLTEATNRANALEAERRTERITGQIEQWKKDGKVLPAEAGGLSEFMQALETAPQTFEFSANDGKPAKKTGPEWFADFMAAQPAKIKLGPQGGAGDTLQTGAKRPEEIAADIREYMATHGTVSYADALAKVTAA